MMRDVCRQGIGNETGLVLELYQLQKLFGKIKHKQSRIILNGIKVDGKDFRIIRLCIDIKAQQ